ncbi:MAG: glucan biosynthesis protein [Gammaproteobacteria bacterium]
MICQSAFSQAEANQAEVNQAEANQGEANQGEANQAEANQGEANQTEVNQPKPDPQVELMNRLVKKAKQLSQQAYQPTARVASDVLKKLNYDEYRSIRFDAEKSFWRHQGLFEIQFFHPGFLYSEMIGLRAMDQAGLIRELNVDVRDFTYGNASLQQRLEAEDTELSYSGFRVHFPVNTKTYKDEIAVFLGASYFRLVGPGQVYGLSARGLAINTAESSGEEFPRFSDFWLVKPAPDCATLIIYALLDSPSVTGLYRFELSTDVATRAHVDVQLFSRTDIKKIGLAPLTSMFFFGEAALQARDDFRHEVHDSDGLLMHTSSDKWIWRPITNPRSLQVTSLHDHNPRGFGLVQRDRDFDHYLDVESHYQNRPSLWVEPQGEWGEGFVELVEIPTDTETNDNITAYWVPKQPFRAGESRQYSYTLSTFDSIPQQTPLAQVSRTLIGWGANPGQHTGLACGVSVATSRG